MIRIDVPATSANLGSGFDSLGIALTMQNRVWMEESDTLEITCTDDTKVPTDESNLIFWAASHLYEICGKKLPGLKIIQENNIPMARGLGSSSACIVAGILGANRFMGNPLSHSDLINLAAQIEGHPDKHQPGPLRGVGCLRHGGQAGLQRKRPVSEKIRFAVMIPPFELKTEEGPGGPAQDLFPGGRGVQPVPLRPDDGLPLFRQPAKPSGGRPGQDPPALPLRPHRPL